MKIILFLLIHGDKENYFYLLSSYPWGTSTIGYSMHLFGGTDGGGPDWVVTPWKPFKVSAHDDEHHP